MLSSNLCELFLLGLFSSVALSAPLASADEEVPPAEETAPNNDEDAAALAAVATTTLKLEKNNRCSDDPEDLEDNKEEQCEEWAQLGECERKKKASKLTALYQLARFYSSGAAS
mgnify:CR=1 FL=1